MMRRPLGITVVAGLPLALFLLAFVLLAIGLFFSFRDISSLLEQSASRKTPALVATAALTRECEWMRGMTFRMIHSDNELVLGSGLQELRERLTKTEAILGQLEQIGLYQIPLSSIREQVGSLSDMVGTLEREVAASLALNLRRTRLVKSLRALSAELESLDSRHPNHSGLSHWSHHMHMGLSLLLVLCTDIDPSYGMRVTTELYDQLTQARQALPHLNDTEDEQTLVAAAQGLYDRLLWCAQADNGVLPLFRSAHELGQSLDSLGLYVDALSDTVTEAADGLFTQASGETIRSRDSLDARIGSLSLWLACFLGFGLLVLLGTCGLLSRTVIRPIIGLNACMRRRTQGLKAMIPRDGAREMQEMATSLAFFINQIDIREEELRGSRDRLEQLVRERTAELSRLSKRLLQTQEEERFRLAAELHDDVGSTISVIKFGIERALFILHQHGETMHAQEPLSEAVELVKGLARQLRRIQHELRPAYLDLGLLASLRMFCQDFQAARTDLHIVLHADIDEPALMAPLRVVVFRVIQEALNNAAKHSGASEITIRLSSYEMGLEASLHDNGCGFDPAAASDGLGLKSMRERVELSGGCFSLHTAPGQGVAIRAVWDRTVCENVEKAAPQSSA